MASLRVNSCMLSSSSASASSSYSSRRITAAFRLSGSQKAWSAEPITGRLVRELNTGSGYVGPAQQLLDLTGDMTAVVTNEPSGPSDAAANSVTKQMYSILEAVADRVEMHRNIGEQRDNWNTLLLNSINMMTLTATAMAGLGAATGGGAPMALKLSSTLLFTAATGMLLVVNKIQPSQLAEEQRNSVRLFKQLESEIRSRLAVRAPTQADVDEAMKKIHALDSAYPLPLLGATLEKFPKKFEPASWWPKAKTNKASAHRSNIKMNHFPSIGARAYLDRRVRSQSEGKNGWSEELEVEMRAIMDVLKRKDEEDYLRLGNISLTANKVLAVSGPALTGLAAVASAFAAGSSGGAAAAAIVAVASGSLAAAVNAFEHGGQVGMVVEMYRNCAGFFRLLEESIEATLEERDVKKRENGELFEMKVALKLGRSLSQLRDLARKSIYSDIEGTEIDEFGSKLF
ncbi:probable F-box protein At4g22030 [Punica granatum]|uniref:Probable F-box protein At4g22030 n=1 Tax=Punica granatum TaxID=22663 RepID=A0A6P8D775_PUNGR|nr:probable F-box protein At4g22030 [Punica granatum]